jgi:dephospho-CoA kinase
VSTRWPDKLVVGLTGNIATGKSVVLELVAEWGALTVDADKVVRQIIESDLAAQREIISYFGEVVRKPDGRIDREGLAGIVFRDPSALKTLENILHPRVRGHILERINLSERAIAFIEAIKLLEGGLAAECDEIWATRCPSEIQIERLMTLRGMDRETAVMRVEAQPPQAHKVAMADVVIDTGGTLDFTRSQVKIAWHRLDEKEDESRVDMELEAARETQTRKTVNEPVKISVSQVEELEKAEQEPAIARRQVESFENVSVRRARRADIPEILQLINRASTGKMTMDREDLLMALGDRGYLIGQQGADVKVVVGWTADNQVAAIDQIFIDAHEFPTSAGLAVLREIECTADELICEVILAFPLADDSLELYDLFETEGYEYVDAKTLPEAWLLAISDQQPDSGVVMIKQLQDLRKTMIRKLKRKQALSNLTSKS